MAGGLFDDTFVDDYNKLKGLTKEELEQLFPMQPMNGPTVDGEPAVPPIGGVMPPGQGGPFDAGGLYTPPTQGPGAPMPPAPPSDPMAGAQMQAPAELLQQLSAARAASDAQDEGGGGGLLGNKPWGPMLMALGGGIAGGVNQGWGAGIGQGFQNAALVRQRQSALDQEEKLARDKMAQYERLANQKSAPAPTTTERLYEAAKEQGYTGTIMDFMKSTKGGTTVNVGDPKFGTIPAGKMLQFDPDGSNPRLVDIPDPAAEQEKAAAAKTELLTSAGKADVVLNATAGIKAAQDDPDRVMPALGPGSDYLAKVPGTAALSAHTQIKELQSKVAIDALQRIREASKSGASGFGALQEKELDLLLNDMGSLDPTADPTVTMRTVERIETRWNAIKEKVRKNATRDDLKKAGVDPEMFFGEGEGIGGGSKGGVDSAIDAEIKRRGL